MPTATPKTRAKTSNAFFSEPPAKRTTVSRSTRVGGGEKTATSASHRAKPALGKSAPTGTSALELLKADHATVKQLFKKFNAAKKDDDQSAMQDLVQAACKALAIHAQIEEEIFYRALREAGNAEDALDEADVEHSHIKELVAQLEASQPGDDLFEARVKVLSEYVEHHVQEEESTVFAKARRAGVDLGVLGEQLQARKAELEASLPRPSGTAIIS